MKNKLNHLFIGIFSLLSLTAFAGNKDANQMLHASAKNTYLFEENKGQIKDQNWQPRPDVLFSGEANGLVHHVLANGISYQMTKVESIKPAEEHFRKGHLPGKEAEMVPDQIGIYRVDVRWVNNNPNMEIIKSNPSKDYNNYYNVPEGVEPALYVRKYEKVTLKNIWQGIDLEYYSKDGILESDWIVHQASDLNKIKFTIKGANLSIDAEGNLVMQTPYGTIKEGGLKVFQSGKSLEASWKLNGEEVSFSVKNYHPELPIRIDPPTRLWGTYYGGSGYEDCRGIVTDCLSNVLGTGFTYSTSAISTIGVHQTNYGGGIYDAFIVKFDSSGTRLWCTYYGGNKGDVCYGIVIDNSEDIEEYSGTVLVTGWTESTTGIATAGSFQPSFGGGFGDAFIAKFDSVGILIWGTYFGGNEYDISYSIAMDKLQNIYLTGNTNSTSNISTSNAHQPISGGSDDAFVVAFDSSGFQLWGTYYGGINGECGYGITTDVYGNVLVTGYTSSSLGISTSGVHQDSLGGYLDAFIVKFNSLGIRIWGTYYGGNLLELCNAITTDGSGNIFVAGKTESSSSIATNGAYQTNYKGYTDAFIAKFDSNGTILWGTYFGDVDNDNAIALLADSNGNVITTGLTESSSNISTIGAFQANLNGLYDAFVVKFNSNGNCNWATYYGGNDLEIGFCITNDKNNSIYVAGSTTSTTSISTIGAYQTNFGLDVDAFIVKFQDDTTTSIFPERFIPFSATLFPNPSLDESYLQILAEKNGEVLLEISDLNGRVLNKDTENILPGENCIQLNVQDFIPGIYFVKLSIDGYAQTLKFCKD